ncbi:transcriptional regulator [Pseudoalteromonas luteoviolacea]|uniref:Transcriptional regulator n=1 Tax=Pseudoalteromonas luteoviolacea TaxID=43657 RepID=A0A1C0TIX1_9GAMM|nr:SirB2 family protein [Pseudoalteromonas luteoviolacea]MBQ4814370.1 SirB2 family protein [Pseudoalteromonas luteoviolacea]OCQ18206.1 transcriptional regulator [Pseudoalteromonas luteoviolacea]
MDYIALKHTHMAFALLSVTLFYTRSISRLVSGKIASKKAVFIASHGTDTLLLISAVYLAVMAGLTPSTQPWLMEKIILVFGYIGLGLVIAKSKQKTKQICALLGATIIIAAIGYLAGTKSAFIL